MSIGAAWTPDLPDDRLADDPAAVIAANEFNPEDLDHFEAVDTCPAVLHRPTRAAYNERGEVLTMDISTTPCEGEPGHYPETPHYATITWYDNPDDALPAEPACSTCADVGIVDGYPCPVDGCIAAQLYIDAAKRRPGTDMGEALGVDTGQYIEGQVRDARDRLEAGEVWHSHGQHGPHAHSAADYANHQQPIDNEHMFTATETTVQL